VPKTKEVLRLRFEVGLGLRQIARSCSIGLGTVHDYLQRAEAAGVTWPLGEDWNEDRLEAALFGGPPRARPAALAMPDLAELHQQRQVHPHLTQQLLWEEYRQANPDGYRYSRFCELYQRWRRKQDVVLRQEHKAGNSARDRQEPQADGDAQDSPVSRGNRFMTGLCHSRVPFGKKRLASTGATNIENSNAPRRAKATRGGALALPA
jgi:hypothetical protein